jgi:SAM-dependent methyltransferase
VKTWYEQDSFWETLARFMFSKERWESAPEEVTNLISLLKMSAGASVLDLCCGQGRHSLELARRGFSVVGVDRTQAYVEKARQKAESEGLKLEFVQEDMRRFCRSDTFEAAINVFTSFGYFEEIKDDEKVAKNVYSSLKDGGAFLIDVMGKEVLARIFRERDWHETEDGIVLEERKISKNWGWSENRWMLMRAKEVEESRFSFRLYSAVELTDLLAKQGFDAIEVYGNLAGAPYDHKADRLVVVAHKIKTSL